jgi:hypothetical protein
MAGDDYAKRERVKMAAWIKPKMAHKQMVQKLLQIRAHLILCVRAEEKIEMVRKDGKMEIVPKVSATGKDGWIPVCEKNLPFEATASFLLLASNPGVPHPIKLQEQHKELFPLDKPITEESGKQIAQWASGGAKFSKTEKPAELKDVLSKIAKADTREAMEAAATAAASLPDKTQKEMARAAYKTRVEELKGAQKEAAPI